MGIIMLDIKLLRENPEVVKKDLKKRGSLEKLDWVDEIREKDEDWRGKLTDLNDLRHERNELTQKIAEKKKNDEDASDIIEKSQDLSDKIDKLESDVEKLKERRDYLLKRLPNIMDESVPKGEGEEDNVPIRNWGKPNVFEDDVDHFVDESVDETKFNELDWKPKIHVDLLEDLKVADTERAAKVAGSRFFYLLGDLVQLNMALIQYSMDKMIEKDYKPVIPPYMLQREVEEGVTSFDDFEEMIYKVENEDLYLIPTSEHALAGMHKDEILQDEDLPIKYMGISPCFRKEAGSHGKDTKGIFRVHQFNKVEQFIFSKPENSWDYHEELINNAEEIYKELNIPYRVVNVCTGDLGMVAAKKYDIETWNPGQGRFREVVSCSNCTGWQARRLNIRHREGTSNETEFVHTLNSTALADTRTIVAILENNQKENGEVEIPEVLREYMNGKEVMKPK